MLLGYNRSEFKSKLKQMSVSELKAELAYYRYIHAINDINIGLNIQRRKFSYIVLQEIWLITKDVNSERYVSIKENITCFSEHISFNLIQSKDSKQTIKFIKNELSLRTNG